MMYFKTALCVSTFHVAQSAIAGWATTGPPFVRRRNSAIGASGQAAADASLRYTATTPLSRFDETAAPTYVGANGSTPICPSDAGIGVDAEGLTPMTTASPLCVSTSTIDFGSTPQYEPVTADLVIQNMSNDTVFVKLPHAWLTSQPLGVHSFGIAAAKRPTMLKPSDSISVELWFTPLDEGSFSDVLNIESAPCTPICESSSSFVTEIGLTGVGVRSPYVLTGLPGVDLQVGNSYKFTASVTDSNNDTVAPVAWDIEDCAAPVFTMSGQHRSDSFTLPIDGVTVLSPSSDSVPTFEFSINEPGAFARYLHVCARMYVMHVI